MSVTPNTAVSEDSLKGLFESARPAYHNTPDGFFESNCTALQLYCKDFFNGDSAARQPYNKTLYGVLVSCAKMHANLTKEAGEVYLYMSGKQLIFSYSPAAIVNHMARLGWDVFAMPIDDQDGFSYSVVNGEPAISHEPSLNGTGNYIGAYAVARKGSRKKIAVVPNNILQEKRKSNSNLLKNHPYQWHQKVALKTLFKQFPTTFAVNEVQEDHFDAETGEVFVSHPQGQDYTDNQGAF